MLPSFGRASRPLASWGCLMASLWDAGFFTYACHLHAPSLHSSTSFNPMLFPSLGSSVRASLLFLSSLRPAFGLCSPCLALCRLLAFRSVFFYVFLNTCCPRPFVMFIFCRRGSSRGYSMRSSLCPCQVSPV